MADYLHCQSSELVYVTNSTYGLNAVARSLKLTSGDEVLTCNQEYGATNRAWQFLAQKQGFIYRIQPISTPFTTHETLIKEFWQGVNANTKVIFLSHITSETAAIFPVQKICQRARQAGILTVIDGAHAPGQIDLELHDLDCDFYTGNLHKWVCSPKGSTFLYARESAQHLLEPFVISFGWQPVKPGPSTLVDYHEYIGTRDLAAFLSVPTALEYQQQRNWPEVRFQCHQLVTNALKRINQITGLDGYYQGGDFWYGQFAAFKLPNHWDVMETKNKLYDDYKIELPIYIWNEQLTGRISIQEYNTQNDVDAFVNAISEMVHS
ncbi:MAG: aminotransferase class V-fold PLP-dependent enzyme [Anaerolineaceae bacterium]|nr:aminotransferase class V-fold PLP-dependent enzyme [Anaerolineaceae bacterium]